MINIFDSIMIEILLIHFFEKWYLKKLFVMMISIQWRH